VTRDRARKKAIRARMAASGEPYSVAARKLDATPPPGDAVVGEVIARVNATLAAPSTWFEYRRDTDSALPERAERHEQRQRPRPSPVGRLARHAARAVWGRFSPEVSPAELGGMLRESFLHYAGVGFAEPTADRYQVDYGGYAELYADGHLWGGPSGAPLRASNRSRSTEPVSDLLGLLRLLRGAAQARYTGEETLRGMPCRTAAVQAGSDAYTVWIDDEHVRQIQYERHGGSRRGGSWTVTTTFELWDLGAPAGSLDWSHFPRFRPPAFLRPVFRVWVLRRQQAEFGLPEPFGVRGVEGVRGGAGVVGGPTGDGCGLVADAGARPGDDRRPAR
jgi:hypothetical protein